MLIEIGKLPQLPQRVLPKVRTHVVRLNTLYDCLRLWVDSLYAKQLFLKHLRPPSAASIPILILHDGELRLLSDLIGDIVGPVIGSGQGKGEAVQRASHIVNHITKDQRKRLQGDWVGTRLEQDILGVVRVDFKEGSTVLSLAKPLLGCLIEIEQVICRSSEFQEVAVLWR